MPKAPPFPPMPSPASPRAIEMLVFPGVQLLDVAGPLQVFATANDLAPGGGSLYRIVVVAAAPGLVAASSGLVLHAEGLPTGEVAVDTLIIPGGAGVYAVADDQSMIAWTRNRAERARRVASVCTGAFVLAEAGLLEGRRAVTHWSRCDAFARRFPDIRLERDPIFIEDGPVWTSAGVTAGIDLALALVEADHGRAHALAVARHLVMFLKRPGGQAQFSTTLALQQGDDRFDPLHAWIAGNLATPLSVAVLAERTGMSERSFLRHYRRATGVTPAQAVERLRVEAARRALAETRWPIKRIAARCGFGSEETMRRSFQRVLAAAPRDYRARFAR